MAFEENENIEQNGRLVELSDSDYEIVEGEPNIEGWDVKDDQGNKIGEVDDLLFDPQSRKVRYMIVELDEDFEATDDSVVDSEVEDDSDDDDRRVLIPIGLAELVPDDEEVFLPGVTELQLNALPLYEKDALTPATEASIRNIFEGSTTSGIVTDAAYSQNDFYNHEHFNEDRFYNREPLASTELEPSTEFEASSYDDVPAVNKEAYVVDQDPSFNDEKQHTGFGTEHTEPEKKDFKNDPLL